MNSYTTEIARLTRLAEDHSRIAAGYREVIKGLMNVNGVDTEQARVRVNGGSKPSTTTKATKIAKVVDKRWTSRQHTKFKATMAKKRAAAQAPPVPIEHTPAALEELRLKMDEVAAAG